MAYYVYFVRCADDTLYCGYTNDVAKRVQTHNRGEGAKYTRSRLPVSLVYTEECETLSAALKREHALKQLSRSQKLQLIEKSGTPL